MKRLWAIAGLVGIFVIAMLAASVQGTPTITPPTLPPNEGQLSTLPPPTGNPTPVPLPEQEDDVIGTIIGIIFLVFGAAALIFLGILLARALMRAWRERPLRVREGDDVAYEVSAEETPQEADAAAPVIRRGIAGALRSIDADATATDAIIAAWVGLEESAADAGITRGVSETPAEFALRIITRRAAITDAARDLLRLYERVRFGAYVAQESDRDAARSALNTIEEGWR